MVHTRGLFMFRTLMGTDLVIHPPSPVPPAPKHSVKLVLIRLLLVTTRTGSRQPTFPAVLLGLPSTVRTGASVRRRLMDISGKKFVDRTQLFRMFSPLKTKARMSKTVVAS